MVTVPILMPGQGCTVVLFDRPVFGAVELNGGGTSTRQIDSLLPHGTYGRINAILAYWRKYFWTKRN